MPSSSSRPPRILLAKPGLDGHNVGLRAVARSLRDAGAEVIYAGMMVTAEEIVAAAAQEDVDVIGLSSLNGTHMTHVPEVIELARSEGLDAKVVLGGIVPPDDVEELRRGGLDAFFGPGASSAEIVEYVRNAAAGRGAVQVQ